MSLPKHLSSQHRIYAIAESLSELLEDREERVFEARRSVTGHYLCLVSGCCRSATTLWSLRCHFLYHHPIDVVNILEEGIPSVTAVGCKQTKAIWGEATSLHRLARPGW